MEKKIRLKECAMCGKVFAVSGRGNRCYCSDRCRHEKILQTAKEYYRETVRRKAGEAYTGPVQGLAETNRRARDAGMSYGKYMLSLRMIKDVPRPEGNPDGAHKMTLTQ